MILEIALGIVLGFILITFLPELFALGMALGAIALAVGGFIVVALLFQSKPEIASALMVAAFFCWVIYALKVKSHSVRHFGDGLVVGIGIALFCIGWIAAIQPIAPIPSGKDLPSYFWIFVAFPLVLFASILTKSIRALRRAGGASAAVELSSGRALFLPGILLGLVMALMVIVPLMDKLAR